MSASLRALKLRPRLIRKNALSVTSRRPFSVSRQVWDIYGNLNNAEARHIRHGGPYEFSESWFYIKLIWKFCMFAPGIFIMWNAGVFDYYFRKRYIPPLEPNWEAEYPYRPPPGYENPYQPSGKLQ